MPKYLNPTLKEFRKEMSFSEFINSCYLKSNDFEHRNILLFSFLTGARPIEIKELKREDFRIEKKKLEVMIKTAKGGSRRLIIIPIKNEYVSKLAYFISTKKFPKEYVFPTFSLKKNIRDYFIRKNKECGIGIFGENNLFFPYSFYFFRHNILTLLAKNGANLIELLFFKGASMKFIFKSVGFYIHMSRDIAYNICKILNRIMSE